MTNIDPAIVEALHAAHADEFTALKDDRYSDAVPASECGNCQRWAKYAAPLLTAALAERDAERAEVARLRAAGRETCREEIDLTERCGDPAEFILWGKLFPPEALGPRCYDHAVGHTSWHMPARVNQWAVSDLRPFLAATEDQP